MNFESPDQFSPTPGYDWVCYNFKCHTLEQVDELHELIENELLHVALGVNITDDLPTHKYNVASNSFYVIVYAETPDEIRKNNLTDLIEETHDHWTTAAIALGYDNDEHGEAAAFESSTYDDTLEIRAVFTGKPDYRGWDVKSALRPYTKFGVYWQYEHPGLNYTFRWPAPDRGHSDPYESAPDGDIDVGKSLENELPTPE